MPSEETSPPHEPGVEGLFDKVKYRDFLKLCDHFRRGVRTAEDAREQNAGACIEPPFAAEYLKLLPQEMRDAFPALLAKLPTTDEGWAKDFHMVGQFDGTEWTHARMIVECRANTEAVRACLLGEVSPPPGGDFIDCVLAARRSRLDEIRDF